MHKKILYAVIVMLIGITIGLSIKVVNGRKVIHEYMEAIEILENRYPNFELPKDIKIDYILKHQKGR